MTRRSPDSCPGVLRLHEAADGPLARIRVPGGRLEPAQLQALADAARDVGDGNLELTSRGNIQLRQVRDADELAARLDAVGLLPSRSHERVRNIVASPLSGRVGGWADVTGLASHLDERLQADPALAELPGRVLFTLDDGRGDVTTLRGDIGIHAVADDEFALVLAGVDTGVRVNASEAVDVMLAAAHGFLDLRGDDAAGQWRLHEIDGAVESIIETLEHSPVTEPLKFGATHQIPIGWLDQDNGLVSLGAGVPLGTLPARTAEFLAAIDRPIFLTPWRSIVITDLDEGPAETVVRVLAPMGMVFDANSPWLEVSACAGQPGCAKALSDVRGEADAAVESGRVQVGAPKSVAGEDIPADEVEVAGRQHWSGCERRCGRPPGPVTDVIATGPSTYRVDPPTT
ncbi:precorrin-3B synthase [Nocardia camponoti]|uniref:Precorrin-3B synthase n=1 Tax=Nocardia camponoti TaxID=1616106 RepID=A0A917Q9G4_9NOCA|nr:precorrin-3B synthase [Nocardia camponoti]GGK36979.1 precorrin-3B synthase [Nocardia camponoti]